MNKVLEKIFEKAIEMKDIDNIRLLKYIKNDHKNKRLFRFDTYPHNDIDCMWGEKFEIDIDVKDDISIRNPFYNAEYATEYVIRQILEHYEVKLEDDKIYLYDNRIGCIYESNHPIHNEFNLFNENTAYLGEPLVINEDGEGVEIAESATFVKDGTGIKIKNMIGR